MAYSTSDTHPSLTPPGYIDPKVKKELENQPFVIGKCPQMCPVSEIKMREREGLIHLLETDPSVFPEKRRREKLRCDPAKAVKCYQRSAAGLDLQNPNLLRPPLVLSQTVDYLLTKVVYDERLPWSERYSFIFDRLRAVKQDLIIQQPNALDCIRILEPMVRFYVVSAYWGTRNDNNGKQETVSADFSPVLNRKQLEECLKYLLSLYDEVGDFNCSSRSQMEAVYQLLYLGETEALLRGIVLPIEIMSQDVQHALKVSLAWYNKQYSTVIRNSKHLSLFLSMAFSLSLPRIRRHALDVMNTAYSSKNLHFPLEVLTCILNFQNAYEARLCCENYGVTVSENRVCFLKGNFAADKQEMDFNGVEYIDEALKRNKLCNLLMNNLDGANTTNICCDIDKLQLNEE
ncbi:hypothetical protein LSTR_LSTR008963 [Laodelphax striatellus]|uniref:SAC3/GANP/THP3 conserved domain-containing protein n=1 Tax=Laodelphax striatellus TaxID=195883 RepID=A0A482WKJ6_LAOST|nr:hypothetical protein LSTR_LSTR008963 [Laodelphax striatellus]